MLPARIAQPILTNCLPILRRSPVVYQKLFNRLKSDKETGLTASRTEVDTNVKPLGEKVKETTKTVSNVGIILLGVGVTGVLVYAVCNELFSSKSPNNVYSKAAKKCIADPRVEDKLGYPIMSYGEENRRGRRRHTSHVTYMGKDGRQHLRMMFHLKGSFHTGTAHLDMVENDAGNYEYRYLFVEVDDMLKNTIVIEDNRNTSPSIRDTPTFEELKY